MLVYAKIHAAVKAKRLPKEKAERLVAKAAAERILTNTEVELVRKADAAREDLIQVDSFPLEGFKSTVLMPVPSGSKSSSAEPGEIDGQERTPLKIQPVDAL